VPCGPVNRLDEAFALAESLGLAPAVSVTDPRTGAAVPQVANPLRLSRTPVGYHRPPPPLGADTDDVLGWLAAEVAAAGPTAATPTPRDTTLRPPTGPANPEETHHDDRPARP
jgi:crotonobetainyl-CoA:carnitine CoA-transferase CaiB-like acyl-CoA transferase